MSRKSLYLSRNSKKTLSLFFLSHTVCRSTVTVTVLTSYKSKNNDSSSSSSSSRQSNLHEAFKNGTRQILLTILPKQSKSKGKSVQDKLNQRPKDPNES